MRHRARRVATALTVLWLAMGPAASAAFACIAETPTFAQALAGADVIARVTIVDGTDYEQPGDVEVFRVDRVLKGNPGPRIELVEPVTYLCGDRVGNLAGGAEGGVGQVIILATGVDFFDQVIHPFWIVVDGRLDGTAGTPDGAEDLATVEASILKALGVPDTSTAPVSDRGVMGEPRIVPVAVVVAAITLAAVVVRRRSLRADR